MSVIRNLFGPSKAEIWRQLSAEIGAQYVEGGFWKGDKVQATHGEWTVTLDTYVVSTGKSTIPFTRMRVPFANPGHFRFTIYRRGIFSDLGKLLGMQDVEIGHPEFDRDFIIKGSDEAKLRTFFANAKIRALIEAQPEINFASKDAAGFFGGRHPPDDRLKLLYELFAETLDELCRIRS